MSTISMGERVVPALLVRDMAATLDFYRTLGFRLTGCYPDPTGATWAEVRRDGVTLQFHTDPPAGTPTSPVCSGTFYLHPESVMALAAELHKVDFAWGPEVMDYGMLEFAVQDPNGYYLAFAEPAGVTRNADVPLGIRDLKPYVPARDFQKSRRFYSALGFEMSEGWGGAADFELNGNRFRLQDYYVKDWADNFMIVMGVDDVGAWHQRARSLVDSGEFDEVRVKPPEAVGDSLVLHVIDPSGVLLIFVQ